MKSFVQVLFNFKNDVIDVSNPKINLFNKMISYTDLCDRIKEITNSYIRTKPLNFKPNVDVNSIVELTKAFDAIPLIKGESAQITIYTPNLYYDKSDVYISRKPTTDLYKIMLIMSSSSIKLTLQTSENFEPNSSFSINTGILIKTTNDIVLVMQKMTCNDPNVIPAVTIRDADSNGPVIINGVTPTGGILGPIHVIFRAYKAEKLLKFIKVTNPGIKPIIKLRDMNPNRFVINPNLNISFKTIEQQDSSLIFKSFNKKGKSRDVIITPPQKTFIVMSTRNREWFIDSLLTLTGIFSKNKYLPPIIQGSYDKLNNTNCLTLIRGKMLINPITSDQNNNMLSHVLNGAYSNISDYKTIRNYFQILEYHVQEIQRNCKLFKSSLNCTWNDYIKLTGYTKDPINVEFCNKYKNDSFMKLEKNDNLTGNDCYQILCDSMLVLISKLLPHKFNDTELNAIRSRSNHIYTDLDCNNSNDIDNDDDVIESKKIKIE